MASTYRVGVIGLGWIGYRAPDNHRKAYEDNPRTELVAICDINRKWQYTDYKKMVGECNLDIVSVCTPVETHCQIVCDIAPYVKAIYCEKPMATTLEECDKMIEACEKNNVVLQINHQRRFINPKFRFSRDLIDTGTHAFDLIRKIFGEILCFEDNQVVTENGQRIEIEYIPGQEHIFELDCTRNKEPMITLGVNQIITCLDYNIPTPSDGYEGRETLKWALIYKELVEKT